ncbi:hypothetical protein GCM10029992_17090 [Glycomyces albus]
MAAAHGTGPDGCGCADWRTDTDLDTEFASDAANLFDTGLYPTEWAETLNDDLNRAAEQAETDAAWAAAKATRAKARARFTTEARTQEPAPEPEGEPRSGPERPSPTAPGPRPDPAFACTATRSDPGPPPFLPCPPREAPAAGASTHTMLQPVPQGCRALRRVRTRPTISDKPPTPFCRRQIEPQHPLGGTASHRPRPSPSSPVDARPNPSPPHPHDSHRLRRKAPRTVAESEH